MAWYHRLIGLFQRDRVEQDLSKEFLFHISERAEELMASGMSEDDAQRTARRQFGNVTLHKERARDIDIAASLETLAREIRFAARSLRKNPMFTITAALCLGLGIGANTAIFTVLNKLVLNPLPLNDVSRLVAVAGLDTRIAAANQNVTEASYLNLADFRERNGAFSNFAIYAPSSPLAWIRGSASERLFAELVTANYFDVLGVRPVMGRLFLPDEDRAPGTHPVAVLSHGAWQRRFGGDPNILGQTLRLNTATLTIIGVAAEGFKGINSLLGPDVWTPLTMSEQLQTGPNRNALRDRTILQFRGAARLKDGISVAQADQNAKVIGRALEQEHPDSNGARSLTVRPITEAVLFGGIGSAVKLGGAVLMVVVGLVLLIACSNVANLLLARAGARRHEVAVRKALGAGRTRLVTQVLTESLLLSVIGGVLGVLLGMVGRDLIWSMPPAAVADNFIFPEMDATVLLFVCAITVATGLIFGAWPALQLSRTDTAQALREESRTSGRSRRRIRIGNALVAGQVALSLVCLVVASLFLRSIRAAYTTDPGFDIQRVALMSVAPGQAGYSEARAEQFYRDVRARLTAVPGVESLSWSTNMPLWARLSRTVHVEGAEQRDRTSGVNAFVATVDVDYFRTIGIALRRGREFADGDRAGAARVAIINEAMAARYWPNTDALGRRFRFAGETEPRQIVGIVETAKIVTLGEEPQPCAYLPLRQNPSTVMMLYVRSDRDDPAPLMGALQREIASLDPGVPVANGSTMTQMIDNALWMARLGVGLLGAFGLLALVLASVGLYGVLAYSVSRRRREIGVRMALGADRHGVTSLVLREGIVLVVAGVAVGLAAAAGLGRLVQSLLVGVSALDPVSLLGASLTLLLVALIACYLPALRASRVDPLTALRES